MVPSPRRSQINSCDIGPPTRLIRKRRCSVGRWIRQKNKSCHPWLDHDHLCIVQMNEHTFASAANRLDSFPTDTTIKCVDSWLQQTGSQSARRPLDPFDRAADDRCDTAAHRFDFGKFRHEFIAPLTVNSAFQRIAIVRCDRLMINGAVRMP